MLKPVIEFTPTSTPSKIKPTFTDFKVSLPTFLIVTFGLIGSVQYGAAPLGSIIFDKVASVLKVRKETSAHHTPYFESLSEAEAL